MILRNTLTATILIGFSSVAFAQQDVQFTQYYHNQIGFNPGVAGSSDAINLNVGHRSQWVGFDNAPTTQNINADIPLSILHGGLVLNIVNDQIGFFQDISAAIGYAYQLDLGPGTLGIGLSIDFRNKNVKTAQWIYPDGTSGSNDPSILRPNTSAMTPELNFGTYYTTDTWYAGLSTTRLLQSEANFGGSARYKSKLHYYLTGGYHIPLEDYQLVLTPSFLVKSDVNSNLSLDLNVNVLFQDKIYGGLGYRNQDAISLMAGYQVLPSLRLAYSYDITTSVLSGYSGGSHEIFLNYSFNIEIPERIPGSYRNVRFL
ncbi:MAG: type IX secretion system membrane protein PorP/SprF [Cryomorphaceae bacterium]|nr:type IX secretion system membrane protein PorP/SprF [Cryomorphaceae bacterium]